MGQRKKPKKETLKKLFNSAGNQCAFPECSHPLIDEDDLFIGQICHIESPKEGGPRHNVQTTDDYKRSYENLILLCYRHHRKVDRFTTIYSIEALKGIKKIHEENNAGSYQIKEKVLDNIYAEINAYWNEIEDLNTTKHLIQDFAMKINTNLDIQSLHLECITSLEYLENIMRDCDEYMDNNWDNILSFLKEYKINTTEIEQILYYKNPFISPLWESRKLGINNWLQKFKLDFLTLIIKSLEQELIQNPQNIRVQEYLDKLREDLKKVADNVCHAD